MNRHHPASRGAAAKAQWWARKLEEQVHSILAPHPQADPENIRHTLILLQQPPMERLQRSLIRGRAVALFQE